MLDLGQQISSQPYFSDGHEPHGVHRGSQSNAEIASPLHRFSKSAIRNAQVLSQVDRKFIACLMNDDLENAHDQGSPSKVLVLIDQHAADERVRVERFLEEVCLEFLPSKEKGEGIRMRELSPSVPVLLTKREALQLVNSNIQRSFEVWGIRFVESSLHVASYDPDEGMGSGGNDFLQVLVSSIPEVVSKKVPRNIGHIFVC
jgi:DNA mismatch repair protein MLH3